MALNKKLFYWVFGIIFSGIVYLLIHNLSFFSQIKDIWYMELALPLTIIFLFFVIGCLISKIPKTSYLLLEKKEKTKFADIENIVNSENSSEEINKLIATIKKLVNFIIKEKYSKESIKTFVEYLGIDPDAAQKIVLHIKKLRVIRRVYWAFGIILSIFIYFLIMFIPGFHFLKGTILPIAISLVVLLLFFIEGFLIIRLPQSFYLNLLGIKDIKQINQQKQLITQKTKRQEEHIKNIKNTIRYLLKIKTDSEFIKKLLIENGFSKQVAENILTNIIKENEIEKISSDKSKLPATANEKITKLFLSKIHEEFLSLKEVYGQINEINKKIDVLEKRQKKINFNRGDSSNKSELSGANILNDPKIPNSKQFNLLLESEEEQEKFEKYMKQIRFLFEFLKPYAKKYTKNQLESFLVSQEYKPEIISDVMNEFKKEGIEFINNQNIQTKVVNFINNIYYGISKKKE